MSKQSSSIELLYFIGIEQTRAKSPLRKGNGRTEPTHVAYEYLSQALFKLGEI